MELQAEIFSKTCLMKFEQINVPSVVGMVHGSGIGTKPLQAYLDGHKGIYMIPGYPLVYFYPHWTTWEKDLNNWTWESIIDIFCEKHASVLDSRQIPGFNGLRTLGENQTEHVEIDKSLFITYLTKFLEEQEICSKTFLLAVHYAYSLCKEEDLSNKHLLIYHIHNVQYLDFLVNDFPDVKIIGMSRDPRVNIGGRVRTACNVDKSKLNATDAMIYRKYIYKNICQHIFSDTYQISKSINKDNVRIIKLEELYYNLELVMKNLCGWLGIQFDDSVLKMSFDGKSWWGDKIYNMKPMNVINPRVVSQDWMKTLGKREWYVIEGVQFDIFEKYNYQVLKYKMDHFFSKILLMLAILLPSSFELDSFKKYINPLVHLSFLRLACAEAKGSLKIKDYTWNGTYLYKWTYIEFQLWKSHRYVKFLLFMRAGKDKNPTSLFHNGLYFLGSVNYVVVSYSRFLWSFFSMPATIFGRCKIMYSALWNRIYGHSSLPDECGAD
jgi:hypothetical protein